MKIRDIVARVNEWADWVARLESSRLGYPSTGSGFGEGASSGKPGSIVPDLAMNPKAAEVDRAVKLMPQDQRELICHKHVTGHGKPIERQKAFCRERALSQSRYYRLEKDAYWFIGGCLEAMKRGA